MSGFLLFVLGLLLGRRGGPDLTRRAPLPTSTPSPFPAPSAPAAMPAAAPAPAPAPAPTSPPWPQVMPAGLPPWPSGWEPDEPVGAGVAARASALLPTLWKYGEGTRKTEQVSGRYITFVAKRHGKLKGVTAFRPKAAAAAPAPSAKGPAPGSRTLRLSGPPRMQGNDVRVLQTMIGAVPDGIFGPATRAAVVAYQGARGLVQDGVVGPKTWGALLGK